MSDTVSKVDEIPNCSFAHRPGLGTVKAVYDGKTFIGSWAYMCEGHFQLYGVGLGLGRGQKLVLKR